MLSANKRRYYREMMENGLAAINIRGKEQTALMEEMEKRFGQINEFQRIPDQFFDFARSARILARMEKTEPSTIIATLKGRIDDLFEIHELKIKTEQIAVVPVLSKEFTALIGVSAKTKSSFPERTMPGDDTIALAAIEHMKETGKIPNLRSGYNHLPETSLTWAKIIKTLREQGKMLPALVEEYARAHSIELPKPEDTAKPKIPKTMPDHDTIAKAAIDILRDKNRLPNMSSGMERLPEGSYPWSGIMQRLRDQKTNVRKIVKDYAHEHGIDISRKRRSEKPAKKKTDDKVSIDRLIEPYAIENGIEISKPRSASGKTQKKEIPSPLVPAKEVCATDLFNKAVKALLKAKALPFDKDVEKSFQENRVTGLEKLFGKKMKPSSLKTFYMAAGLAQIDKNGDLKPADFAVVCQYARLISG